MFLSNATNSEPPFIFGFIHALHLVTTSLPWHHCNSNPSSVESTLIPWNKQASLAASPSTGLENKTLLSTPTAVHTWWINTWECVERCALLLHDSSELRLVNNDRHSQALWTLTGHVGIPQRKNLLLEACSSVAPETNLRFSSQPHFSFYFDSNVSHMFLLKFTRSNRWDRVIRGSHTWDIREIPC